MIIYDLETTGVDVIKDRIIEIYALKIEGETKSELHHFVNPGIPIPKEASDVHGYTDEFVKDKPMLKEVIAEIDSFFAGQNLVGYNNRKFDNLLLNVEFLRCGYDLKLEERKIIDVFEMWSVLEPRNLGGAYNRFCNESSENLHNAKEDVEVVNKVYEKMLKVFSLEGKSFEEISNTSHPDENSLCFGKLLIDDDGKLTFNFGKHSGKTIEEISTIDYDYLKWMVNESSTESSIKYYIITELKKLKQTK